MQSCPVPSTSRAPVQLLRPCPPGSRRAAPRRTRRRPDGNQGHRGLRMLAPGPNRHHRCDRSSCRPDRIGTPTARSSRTWRRILTPAWNAGTRATGCSPASTTGLTSSGGSGRRHMSLGRSGAAAWCRRLLAPDNEGENQQLPGGTR